MKWTVAVISVHVVAAFSPLLAEEFLDRVDEMLTITSRDDYYRARLSGIADVEFYQFDNPAPALLYTEDDSLFNPRLSLFLDAQMGPSVYAFAQSRIDRGFDPSDDSAEVRLDEYAIRYTPWDDSRLNVQAGRFATVVGNWVSRHDSWENPFVNAPLPYENPVPINDSEAPESAHGLPHISSAEKYEYIPVIWGPSYASGMALSGRLNTLDYAIEIKNAPLSSRPETWDVGDNSFSRPTYSSRIGLRPNASWSFGLSGSVGPIYRNEADSTLPAGRTTSDYNQIVFGQDVAFAWRHLQVWAEVYEVRFELPTIGSVDTWAYYVEAKYKFTPRLFGALRWNQQMFSDITLYDGGRSSWSRDIWRSDVGLGYRFSAHTQLKLQYSLQQEDGAPHDTANLAAAQLTVRF